MPESLDPGQNTSIEVATSPVTAASASVSRSLSVAPTENYILTEKQKEFQKNQIGADRQTDVMTVNRDYGLYQLSEKEKDFKSSSEYKNALKQSEAEKASILAADMQRASNGFGRTVKSVQTSGELYNSELDTQKEKLDALKEIVQTSDYADERHQALLEIRDQTAKINNLISLSPTEITQKYPTKVTEFSVTERFNMQGSGSSSPTLSLSQEIAQAAARGEPYTAAQIAGMTPQGGGNALVSPTSPGGAIYEANARGEPLSAATQKAIIQQYLDQKFAIHTVTPVPSITQKSISDAIAKITLNPYNPEITPQDRAIYEAQRQLADPTQHLTESGLAQIAQNLQGAGISAATAAGIIASMPTGQGSVEYQTLIAAAKPKPFTETSSLLTPAFAAPISVGLGTLPRPFTSVGKSAPAVEIKSSNDWLEGARAMFSKTPLGAYLVGNQEERTKAEDLRQSIEKYSLFASPALLVGGNAKLPTLPAIKELGKTSTGIIDTLFGAKSPASIVSTSFAVIPGALTLAGKGTDTFNPKGKGVLYSPVTVPEALPSGAKQGTPLKTGIFSEDFFRAETPAQLKAGSLDMTKWTQERQLGGGLNKEAYASHKAIPSDIKDAFEFKYDNDSRTGYAFIDKGGNFQILVDSGIWKSSGSETSWNALLRGEINPLATGLNEKGERVKGNASDVAAYLQQHGKRIDVQDPEVLNRFYSNMEAKQRAVIRADMAKSADYEIVLKHRYERSENIPVGTLSDQMWKNIKIARTTIPSTSILSSKETSSTTSLIAQKYQLPTMKSGILDTSPFPTEPVNDIDQYGTLKEYEGIINTSIEIGKPINQSYIKNLDNSTLTSDQKAGLTNWISAYNESISSQNDILSALNDKKTLNYDKLYTEALGIAKYSPVMAATMYLNVEQSERVSKANQIIPVLGDPTISAATRLSNEKQLSDLISGIQDPGIKSKYSALPSEFRTFSGLVNEINTTQPKSIAFDDKTKKIQAFNTSVDTLTDFDPKTRTDLKIEYAKVAEQATIPERVRALSFGGIISDFTKSFGALKSGDLLGTYENYQQGLSRYTTRAAMPDITGASKIIENSPGSLNTPMGHAVLFGANLGESVYTNIREKPIEDVVLYELPTLFGAGEYGISRLIAGSVKADLPIISTAGRAASTPLASDVGTLAKVGLGVLYAGQSTQHVLWGGETTTKDYGKRTGDVAYQLLGMGLGTKAVPEFAGVDNPMAGRKFFSGELGRGPIEIAKFKIDTFLRGFASSDRAAYGDVAKIAPSGRFVEPEVKAEPDFSVPSKSGKYGKEIKEVLNEQPSVTMGSASLKQQYTPDVQLQVYFRTPKDVDALIYSPKTAIESLSAKTGLSGSRAEGMLDLHPIPKNYPGMKPSIETKPEIDEVSFLTKLFGDPYAKLAFPRGSSEVVFGGKSYTGETTYEAAQVQYGRKAAAVAAVVEDPISKGYRGEKDIFDFINQYKAQKIVGLKTGVPAKNFVASDKAMEDFMTRKLTLGTKKGQKLGDGSPTKTRLIKDIYEAGKKTTSQPSAPQYNAHKGYTSSIAKISYPTISSFKTPATQQNTFLSSAKTVYSTRSPSATPSAASYSAIFSPSLSRSMISPSSIISPSYIGSPASSIISPPSSKLSPPSSSFSPSLSPSSKISSPSISPSAYSSPSPSPSPYSSASPYSSPSIRSPRIVAPALLGGALFGGGEGEPHRPRNIKKYKIRQPIRTGKELLSGRYMPKISYNLGGKSKSAPTASSIKKKIRKMFT